jgi:cadmium resistance protein CadD (predicted permease)
VAEVLLVAPSIAWLVMSSYLPEVSPWVAGVLSLLVIILGMYVRIRRQDEADDARVGNRWLPP